MTPHMPRGQQKAKDAPKKRVTTAALTKQLSSHMELVPSMVDQISELRRDRTLFKTLLRSKGPRPLHERANCRLGARSKEWPIL